MDKQALAVLIPVLAVFFVGMVGLSRTAIGLALARRIGGERPGADELHQHLAEVQAELADLRAQLADTQERLDFSERLLAQHPEAPRLGSSARE